MNLSTTKGRERKTGPITDPRLIIYDIVGQRTIPTVLVCGIGCVFVHYMNTTHILYWDQQTPVTPKIKYLMMLYWNWLTLTMFLKHVHSYTRVPKTLYFHEFLIEILPIIIMIRGFPYLKIFVYSEKEHIIKMRTTVLE